MVHVAHRAQLPFEADTRSQQYGQREPTAVIEGAEIDGNGGR